MLFAPFSIRPNNGRSSPLSRRQRPTTARMSRQSDRPCCEGCDLGRDLLGPTLASCPCDDTMVANSPSSIKPINKPALRPSSIIPATWCPTTVPSITTFQMHLHRSQQSRAWRRLLITARPAAARRRACSRCSLAALRRDDRCRRRSSCRRGQRCWEPYPTLLCT
ncbi:uncharacterized protein B0I36DRAFT_325492 [Microdochium trichocladiopsis]|uniref:Uncharacterized protein n=1 Tax=Microdochium trichocladiopsis TaxID=1682393 RepID=A0A9P8Y447_9PEZI|nr:uncharacterized protein B0I36DRAFT_325492 [Microdochium trichocladiopsis]KAH7029311.1 hypothetical protein B0I36DRAFT_325492 [Microdochium trichocladiopsis]